MAKKKTTDDEITKYIQSKQISSDKYVAPTVQTNYRRSDNANSNNTPITTSRTTSMNRQPTVSQTVTMPSMNKNSNVLNRAASMSPANDKIALFNNANQSLQNKKIDELNEQNKNGGFFKSGDSNLLSGILNTGLDFGADVGKGFFQTLEGLADFAQYKSSDMDKLTSAAIEKTLGKNAISDLVRKRSDWLKENAKADSTGSLFGTNEDAQQTLFGNEWRKNIDKSSYLGDMSDSIGEGIGNIGAMAALSAVGSAGMGAAGVGTTATGALTTGGKLALSGGTSYTTAYGNARSEAYRNGATDDEANKYAIINGLSEAVSEQFFDAMPGIKSVGVAEKLGVKDFLANKIKSGIGSKTAKVFTRLAGGLGEGGEEIISNALNAIGSDLMHMLDNSYTYGMEHNSGNPLEDGWNALFSEDSLKSFFSAFFTSAILGIGGDTITAAQENQLAHAISEDRGISVAEAKQEINKIKTQLEERVRNEAEKGNIDASNDVEIEDIARKQAIKSMKAGLKQGQNVTQNTQETAQLLEQAETPQIRTNEQESTNTQATPQNVVNEQKTNENEVSRNNEQEEQDLIREINIEQQKLDNGKSEDDGYHLAELQKELQDRQKKSIANDSNTFNLNKVNENTALERVRTPEELSSRKTNAFQYDNPQVKPYFRDAAYDLREALDNYTAKGERYMREDGSWGGNKFSSTPEISELKNDYNMSYDQISKGIDGIIKDEGKENNAASKKVEVVIDKMLRNGYRSEFDELTNKPNQEYLDTLAGKQVDNQVTEQEDEEDLPFWTDEDERKFQEKQKKQEAEQETKQKGVISEGKRAEWTKSRDSVIEHMTRIANVSDGTSHELTSEQKLELINDALEMGGFEKITELPSESKTQKATQEVKPQEQNDNIAERKNDEVLTVELTGEKGQKYFEENGIDEKVAKILSETPKQQKEKIGDTLKDVAGESYRLLVSNAGEIERISKLTKTPTVKFKYDRSLRARSEAQQHIGNAQADLNGKKYKNFVNENGKKVNMSLNDIRQDAKSNGISEQALNEYLAHWLNVDRYAEGKPVFSKNFDSEMSMEEIAKLDEQYPELHRIAQNVWTYEHNELKNLYDSGLITKKAYNNLAKNEHYVRIQRNMENQKHSDRTIIDKNGNLSVDNTIQEAKGGNQDILPIMEGIAKYTETMLQAERKNQAVAELAKAMGVGSQNDSLDYNEESFGVNPEFVKSNDDGSYTMTYFNKGVATEIPINKAIYDAFVKNKAISAVENNKAFKVFTYAPKKLSTMFRGLTTNYNPMFMITNAFKDIGDAPFNSKHTKEFIKTYASTEALRQVAGNGVYNQLYSQLGGQDDSYFTEGEFKDKAQSKFGKVTEKLLTPITKGNEIVESVPRVAEFIATIKANGYEVNKDGELVLKDKSKAKGKTAIEVMDEALYNAAEVTTNFKRGGDLAKSINRNGGTFFNASIQGFDKQIRNFKDAFTSGDKKMVVALLLKAIVFGIAPTMINDGMYDDDDEYEELQDYLKDNYYLFKGKDGSWIRIPKGRAMSVLGSAFRRGKDYSKGSKDAFKGFAEFASGQVAPNNPFESNIVSPFFAVRDNKSWSGNKIISQSLEKKPTDEQYNEKTDEFSKWLGKQLKNAPIPDNFKSPMGINYLIDQYTGGAGDVFLPMLTPKATGKTENPLIQPFISKFSSDSEYSSKSVGTFYDTMTELEKKKNSVNADKMDKLKYSYIYSQNMKMAELKKEQSAIQSDKTLSNEEKYEQAREIQKDINKLAKKSVKDLDNIDNNTYYAIVGDNTYYLDKDGSFKKDAYADSNKKSADKKGMALYDYYKEKYEKKMEKEAK